MGVSAEQFSDPVLANGCAPHEEESSWQSVHISSRNRQGDQENARNPDSQAFGLTSRRRVSEASRNVGTFNDAVLPREEDARGHEQLAAACKIRKTALAERMTSAA
jgi:hypothetical protein